MLTSEKERLRAQVYIAFMSIGLDIILKIKTYFHSDVEIFFKDYVLGIFRPLFDRTAEDMKGVYDLQQRVAGQSRTQARCVEEYTSIYGRPLYQLSYLGADQTHVDPVHIL